MQFVESDFSKSMKAIAMPCLPTIEEPSEPSMKTTTVENPDPEPRSSPDTRNQEPGNFFIPEISILPRLTKDSDEVVWGNIPYRELAAKLDSIYEDMVLYKKNLFKIPSGKAGKEFVAELPFWLRQFNRSTKLNGVALKAVFVIPTLLLQKPSAKSKAKQHLLSLERRLKLWRSGNLDELIREVRHIQSGFDTTTSRSKNQTNNLSKKFSKFMSEGNISAALKLLDKTNSTGLLPLTEEVMKELRSKHPNPVPPTSDSLLCGPIQNIPDCFFDGIDEQAILKAAKDTKGSGGPSGMDADQYRRLLCSKNFLKEAKALREELAEFARKLATNMYDPQLVEVYIACRLIPLDKDPGIRPIGIGEVLRRIVGKAISRTSSSYIKEAAGPLQTCAGHGAGAEAAIHAMRQIFSNEGTDAVLLIDASNAFNRLNRAAALHNVQITCPVIATYLINTYRHPASLYVAGGQKILSMEGTTQGDPLAMAWYSLSTVVLIDALREKIPDVKQVWLADDASAAGKLNALKIWYDCLVEEGRKSGYFVNKSKCWLIVKDKNLKEEASKIFGEEVNITEDGQRHLGAAIGSDDFKDSYCKDKVDKWMNELLVLSEIADTNPQAAYAAYTKGFRSKFTYFMRTIEGFENYLEPLDNTINEQLIPSFFGSDTPMDELRGVFALNPGDGGLGMPVPSKEAAQQHASSLLITQPHVQSIIDQEKNIREKCPAGNSQEDLKKLDKGKRNALSKEIITDLDSQLPEATRRHVIQARDKGASSWLNALPIEDMSFSLNKEEFRDALRLRYNLNLENLPTRCPCGQPFNVTHALSCKKGGFVNERHDNVKNILTGLLSRVCRDVESEPHLMSLTNEQFSKRSANLSDEARLDIKAKSFWQRGQTAFFDVRITHVNAANQQKDNTKKIFRQHEQAKKREYMERVLQVENGSFTPLVFGTNGGLGEECQRFLQTLANKLASKDGENYAQTMTWLRTRLSFEILRSAIACVRGSRVPFRSNNQEELRDFDLKVIQGGLQQK